MTRQIVLVAGLPCAGKTTLSSTLATVMHAHHVSLGDLARNRGGRDPDVGSWSELVQTHLADLAQELVIVDAGGPPLDEVARRLDAEIRCALLLVAPAQTRETRFAARALTARRSDDVPAVFHSRSATLGEQMEGFGHALSRLCPTFRIDAGGSAHTTLRAALQALAMADLERARRAVEPSVRTVPAHAFARPGALQELWGARDPITIATTSSDRTGLLLLMKPGVGATAVVEAAVLARLQQLGCTVEGAAVWSRRSGMLPLLARAHLGLHHVIAQAGAAALDASPLPGALPMLGGFAFEQRFGRDACEAAWRDREARKIGPYAWACPVEARGLMMINGHIPSIVRSYAEAERVMALHIWAPLACTTDQLRRDLLGATDPAHAVPGSLRRMAFDGELDLGWTPSVRNNAFHLSDSSEQGVRELGIWFGYGQESSS